MSLLSTVRSWFSNIDKDIADIETANEREDVNAKQEELSIPSERSLINQIMLAYDKKSKLVAATNLVIHATAGVSSSLKSLFGGFKVLRVKIGALPTAAGLKALKGATMALGAKIDTSVGDAYLEQVTNSVKQIQSALALAGQKESPIAAAAKNSLDAVTAQQKLVADYATLLAAERKRLTEEVADADAEVKRLVYVQAELAQEGDALTAKIIDLNKALKAAPKAA